jgi:hypothetical protein
MLFRRTNSCLLISLIFGGFNAFFVFAYALADNFDAEAFYLLR